MLTSMYGWMEVRHRLSQYELVSKRTLYMPGVKSSRLIIPKQQPFSSVNLKRHQTGYLLQVEKVYFRFIFSPYLKCLKRRKKHFQNLPYTQHVPDNQFRAESMQTHVHLDCWNSTSCVQHMYGEWAGPWCCCCCCHRQLDSCKDLLVLTV